MNKRSPERKFPISSLGKRRLDDVIDCEIWVAMTCNSKRTTSTHAVRTCSSTLAITSISNSTEFVITLAIIPI